MTIRVKKRDRRSKAPSPWLVTGALVAYGALGGRVAPRPARGHALVRGERGPGRRPAAGPAVRHPGRHAGRVDRGLPAGERRRRPGRPGTWPPSAPPAVSGTFTPEQALHQLLEGTGVAYRFTSPDAVVLELRLRETVEVTAAVAKPASPKYTRAAARHPADDHGDPAGGDRGAGRDDPARRAAQRHRHQHPGRRGRRARRRQPVDPRLQRAHRHLHRRRARLRRLLARPVQRRAGRGGEGPGVVVRAAAARPAAPSTW